MKPVNHKKNLANLFLRNDNHFTLIRFLLSSLVVFAHCFPLADGSTDLQPYGDTTREWLYHLSDGQVYSGSLAVYLFFFLSGFLITASFLNSKTVLVYFYKRVLRIYPAFIVCTLLGGLVVAPISIGFEQYYNLFSGWSFFKSIMLLQQPEIPRVFLNNPYAGESNGSLWTIKLEFLAYIMIAILGALKLLRARIVGVICIFLYICHAFKQIRPDLVFANDLELYPFGYLSQYPEVLLFFFIGVLANLKSEKISLDGRYAGGCALILLVSLFIGGANFVLPFTASYLLLFAGFIKIGGEEKRTVGKERDVSYGVYLYSFLIQQSLLFAFPELFVRSPYALFVASYPVACLTAYFSWQLIEKPALELKTKFQ